MTTLRQVGTFQNTESTILDTETPGGIARPGASIEGDLTGPARRTRSPAGPLRVYPAMPLPVADSDFRVHCQ
jgi:hypothetical protein